MAKRVLFAAALLLAFLLEPQTAAAQRGGDMSLPALLRSGSVFSAVEQYLSELSLRKPEARYPMLLALISLIKSTQSTDDEKLAAATILSLNERWAVSEDSTAQFKALKDIHEAIRLTIERLNKNAKPSRSENYLAIERIRFALEEALANGEGSFRSATVIPFTSRSNIDQRIEALGKLEEFHYSLYALRAVMLRAHARIISVTAKIDGTKADLEKALGDYDLLLCSSSADAISRFKFCNGKSNGRNYFWRSPEAWRWLNDAIFERVVILRLLGRGQEASEMLELLKDWQPVLADEALGIGSRPYYADIGAAAVATVQTRSQYVDQIHIYQPIPGLLKPIGRYFSTKDVAEHLVTVLLQFRAIKTSAEDVASLEYLRFVNEFAVELYRIERKDNVFIIASLKRRTDAERLAKDANRQIKKEQPWQEKFGDEYGFSVENVKDRNGGTIYRVQIKNNLTDTQILDVQEIYRSIRVTAEKPFVSRPMVP